MLSEQHTPVAKHLEADPDLWQWDDVQDYHGSNTMEMHIGNPLLFENMHFMPDAGAGQVGGSGSAGQRSQYLQVSPEVEYVYQNANQNYSNVSPEVERVQPRLQEPPAASSSVVTRATASPMAGCQSARTNHAEPAPPAEPATASVGRSKGNADWSRALSHACG